MLEFKGQLYTINFDVAKFKKTLTEKMETQLRQAARAWLRAVIPAVPVFTGTARGTLQPLGRILRVAVPISPIATRKGKGPSVGASASTFNFTSSNNIYTFSWSNDVLHYYINEYNDMSGLIPLKNPTPWQSIEKGNAAFQLYFDTELQKQLPDMGDFLRYNKA